jgi:hypothetical protein
VDRLRALDLFDCHLRQAQVANLAGGDGLGQSGPGLLDRHVGIDTVQLIQVDVIGAQPAQARVDGGPDVFWPAIERQAGWHTWLGAGDRAHLGGHNRTLAVTAGERSADKNLIGVRPVGVAVDGVGIAREPDEPVALDGHMAADGFFGLGDLLIDPAKDAPGPVVSVLIVDDLVTAAAVGPGRPRLGEHVAVGDLIARVVTMPLGHHIGEP